jgi:hypothetical protein
VRAFVTRDFREGVRDFFIKGVIKREIEGRALGNGYNGAYRGCFKVGKELWGC